MVARSSLGRRSRSAYVASTRGLRSALGYAGLLQRLDARVTPGRFSAATHARSLLSVYDAVDLSQLDLPWWTYPATRAVEEHLQARGGHARVYEYGAGASTLWLRARAGDVTSVEHDLEFLEMLQPHLLAAGGHGRVLGRPISSTGTAAPTEEYVSSIDTVPGEFDLIVVDGRERVRCVAAALPRLAKGGVVLLDDSQRRRYQPALEMAGTVVTEYTGFVPTLPLPRRTALIRHVA
jgi:hypothetical protein